MVVIVINHSPININLPWSCIGGIIIKCSVAHHASCNQYHWPSGNMHAVKRETNR